MQKLVDLPTIALSGLKHCGKTSVARLLADDLGLRCFDLDKIIADLIRTDGLSEVLDDSVCIRSFYQSAGQKTFKEFELRAFEYLENDMPNQIVGNVLSLGGGTMENTALMSIIKSSGTVVVFIDVEESVLYSRIIKTGIPAFLDQDYPRESFSLIYSKRRDLAHTQADIVIDGNFLDIPDVKARTERSLEEYFNGRK